MSADILYPPDEASATVHRTIHCCLDIRGALRWPLRRLRGMFRIDGRACSGAQAREILLDHLSQGRRVLPMGEPCEGFSYETGCPGHQEKTA